MWGEWPTLSLVHCQDRTDQYLKSANQSYIQFSHHLFQCTVLRQEFINCPLCVNYDSWVRTVAYEESANKFFLLDSKRQTLKTLSIDLSDIQYCASLVIHLDKYRKIPILILGPGEGLYFAKAIFVLHKLCGGKSHSFCLRIRTNTASWYI